MSHTSKTRIILAMILLIGGPSFAQQMKRCASMEYLKDQIQKDPSIAEKIKDLRNLIANSQANQRLEQSNANITIPVVVHVVYKTTAQKLSVARVQSQIDVLNEDYARLNADRFNTPTGFQSVAADTKIRFCLAQRDPSGNATTGITYDSTTVTTFGTDNKVKFRNQGGADIWDRNQYLNIWVCNLGSSLLGYSQFPNGGQANTDGVVILYTAFGRPGTLTDYNLGRTTTHEVGHWFGLYHTWGDDGGACAGTAQGGDDAVADTPDQADQTWGCPSGVITDACNNSANGIMYMNYMDYTNDNCMNLFTQGQTTAMTSILNVVRKTLKTSKGCTPAVTGMEEQPIALAAVQVFPNPTSETATVDFGGEPIHEIALYDLLGKRIWMKQVTVGTPNETIDFSNLGDGLYTLQINSADKQTHRKIVVKK
jgi:hypothetical protein